MKRMTLIGTAAVLAAGVMAAATGCQNSGERDDTGRAARASATYDRAYVATRDSEWVSSPGGATHTLPRGTRAYFSTAPGTSEWQQAKVEGQGVVYVRPADFMMEAR
jgi:hypothetical protein